MTKFHYLAIATVIVLTIIILIVKKVRSTNATLPWPYYAKKPLTNPEQILYYRIAEAMPECLVLAQVQLSRFLGVNKGFRFVEWNSRINQKSIDFLVCLKDSTIVAAIELDDRSHENLSRKKSDATKERALTSAGIALIRWNVRELPSTDEIRSALTR